LRGGSASYYGIVEADAKWAFRDQGQAATWVRRPETPRPRACPVGCQERISEDVARCIDGGATPPDGCFVDVGATRKLRGG